MQRAEMRGRASGEGCSKKASSEAARQRAGRGGGGQKRTSRRCGRRHGAARFPGELLGNEAPPGSGGA